MKKDDFSDIIIPNYRGDDLSPDFIRLKNKEKKRLKTLLEAAKATKIRFNFGRYYFYGYFTANNGQIYSFNSRDVRHIRYEKLVFRTAEHYLDTISGVNQYIGKSDEEIMAFLKTTMKED